MRCGIVGVDLEARRGAFGWQLHALRAFPCGSAVALCTGQLLPWSEARHLPVEETSHIRSVTAMRWVVDGSKLSDGRPITDPNVQLAGVESGGLFANDAYNQEGKQNNTVFEHWDPPDQVALFERCPRKRRVFQMAIRDIELGEEILVDYGRDYWARRGK